MSYNTIVYLRARPFVTYMLTIRNFDILNFVLGYLVVRLNKILIKDPQSIILS